MIIDFFCSRKCFQQEFMSPPAMAITNDDATETEFQKGVKHLIENGVSKLPNKYILPVSDRPNVDKEQPNVAKSNLKLPIIDFAELQGSNRSQVLNSLSSACEEYGFFQVARPQDIDININCKQK